MNSVARVKLRFFKVKPPEVLEFTHVEGPNTLGYVQVILVTEEGKEIDLVIQRMEHWPDEIVMELRPSAVEYFAIQAEKRRLGLVQVQR